MNDFIKMLNAYRRVVKGVRTGELTNQLASAARNATVGGSPFEHVMALPGATNDIIVPSVCELVGSKDVLMPLVTSLKHLQIDDGWRLDGALKGSYFASVIELFVTDGRRATFPFDHISLDGSPESIWQALIFRIWGELLFRGWHAGYGDYRIVTSYETAGEETSGLVVNAKNAMAELGNKDRVLERWAFTPIVEMCDQTGKVTFTTFSPFGGFMKYQEVLRIRSFERVSLKKIAELPYECQICY